MSKHVIHVVFFPVKFIFSCCVTTHVIAFVSIVFKNSSFELKLRLLSCAVLERCLRTSLDKRCQCWRSCTCILCQLLCSWRSLTSRLCRTTGWICSGLFGKTGRICCHLKVILNTSRLCSVAGSRLVNNQFRYHHSHFASITVAAVIHTNMGRRWKRCHMLRHDNVSTTHCQTSEVDCLNSDLVVNERLKVFPVAV